MNTRTTSTKMSKTMKTRTFCELDDLAFDANETLEEVEREYDKEDVNGGMVTVIAQYQDARELLACFITLGYDLDYIDLEDPEYNGYNDAFIITIYGALVSCEKFKRESGYINDESDATYLFDNCNSKIIPHIKSKTVYEVHMMEDESDIDEYDDDDDFWEDDDLHFCDHGFSNYSTVTLNKDSNGEIHGFIASKMMNGTSFTSSYYSCEPMSKKEADEMVEILGF